MKKNLAILLVLVSAVFCLAQDSPDIDKMITDGKAQIQNAVDTWDVAELISTRGYFERLLGLGKSAALIHYYIAYTDYRIVTYYFTSEDLEGSQKYIDDSISHLELAIELDDHFAEAHILLSTMYGNKIAVKPIMGMTLGMKTGSHANKAVKLSPNNPRVAFLSGSNAYYTPKIFGGSKERALKHFNEALTCFSEFKPASHIDPDWGLEDTHLYLGLVNKDLGNTAEALRHLNTCLELKPYHGWAMALKAELTQESKTEK